MCLGLTFLTSKKITMVHPCCSIHHNFLPFMHKQYSIVYIYHILFIYFLLMDAWTVLCLLASVTAMNVGTQILV